MLTATADPVRTNETVETVTPTRLELVALSQLKPSPLNPRRRFDGLEELARNLKARGVVVPLLVRRRPENVDEVRSRVLHLAPLDASDDLSRGELVPTFEVVDGERRYRAAQIAGLTIVPVVVRDLTDDEVLEIQLVSAVQRADLTPLEEARGYRALIDSNPSRYSARYIGDRIGRSERYVVDRMRLLSLIPDLQRLLEQERIGVAHAEVLAKLKPEDQARAADPGDRDSFRENHGGLWAGREHGLDFDRSADDDAPSVDEYEGLKVATIKELEAWIARHVRFDIEHAAKTAPLEFERVQQQLAAAQEKPGRGKKTIQITHDAQLKDDVKDSSTRVYGPRSWRRADGTVASVYDYSKGKYVDAPTCEYAVLGHVVVGPEYGKAFEVCIARDKCRTHWDAEIREKEKAAKAAASGKAGTKSTAEPVEDFVIWGESDFKTQWKARAAREAEARALENKVYAVLHPILVAKLRGAVPATLNLKAFAWLYQQIGRGRRAPANVKPAQFVAELVLARIDEPSPTHWLPQDQIRGALAIASAFGVDGKALEKAARKHVTETTRAADKKTPAAKASKPSAKAGRKK